MKKLLITLCAFLSFISYANTDSDNSDSDRSAQKALAEKYVQALQNKDLNTINQLIDYDAYADRLFSQLSTSKKLSKKYKASFIRGQKGYQKLYSNNAYITLIGWREMPSFSGYLVRLLDENYSSSYIGLVVKKTNNQQKIVDFYDATRQDTDSHFRAEMLQQMVLGNDSIFKQLKKNDDIADSKKFDLFVKQLRGKQFAEAVKTYRGFSDKLKKEEGIIDLGLAISHYYTDEQFYNELLTVIGQYQQNNPKYYGQVLGYFLMEKDYDKAREISKNIFTAVSDKAMMNFKLVSISLAEEDYPRALKKIKQCVKAEPKFTPCYDSWLGVADKIKNYDEEVAAYNALSKNLGNQYTKSMFNEQEDGDFIHSDAFKNWDIPEK